jgi:hypothetical protein
MKEAIKDVTKLYIQSIIEDIESTDIEVIQHCIKTTRAFLYDETVGCVSKTHVNEDIINKFIDLDLPEYCNIIRLSIDHLERNKKNYPKNVLMTINIIVNVESKLAKGHRGKQDIIRLFAIFIKITNNKVNIQNISINGKLFTEKFDLCKKEYTDEILDYENDNIKNEFVCTICLSSKGSMIETSCGHKFHLNCLKSVPNLCCPLCRRDITDCLKNNGVTDDEINERLLKQKNNKEFENLCEAINEIEISQLSEHDFIKLCMQTLKLNNGDMISYNEIIFDMNANASRLFAEISHHKSKTEKGIFLYLYDSPVEFIMQMKDPYNLSVVQWVHLSEFIDTPLWDVIKNRTDRIINTEEEYVVCIMIENVVNAHIINKRANEGKYGIRINQRDILNSIIKCIRCRCSGNDQSSPNREYTWAKSVLNNIKKKNKKRINKN